MTSFDNLDLSKTYAYADYVPWRFEDMVELLHGKVFKMSPAPSVKHQRMSRKLSFSINKHLASQKRCELFVAPFDVRLYDRQKSVKADQEIFTPLFLVSLPTTFLI